MSLTADPTTNHPIHPEATWLGSVQDGIMFATGCFDRSVIDRVDLLAADLAAEIGAPGQTMTGLNAAKQTTDFVLTEEAWAEENTPGEWTAEALAGLGYDLGELERGIFEGVGRLIELYGQQFPNIPLIPLLDTGYLVQTYAEGSGYYRPHTDTRPGDPDSTHRVLAIVIYLNTVGEGGDTVFPRHGVSVSPSAGAALVFPATWLHVHESTEPIGTDKRIISTFVYTEPDEHAH